MERWSIAVNKEAFKFSSAHFLIFPDGSAERLHGHNYRVSVALYGELSRFGLVLDFNRMKPLVKKICKRLNEQWLIPGEHAVLTHSLRADGVVEVRYLDRYYAAPQEDVTILPINNTSVENLSAWFGRTLLEEIHAQFPDVMVEELTVSVEETAGQRAQYHYSAQA